MSAAPSLTRRRCYKARVEEVMEFYDKFSIKECWTNTVEGPITPKWINICKGIKQIQCINAALMSEKFFSARIILQLFHILG